MDIKTLVKKYGLYIGEEETIEDLEKDIQQSKKLVQKLLASVKKMDTLLREYKNLLNIILAYENRIEKLEKVIKDANA